MCCSQEAANRETPPALASDTGTRASQRHLRDDAGS
jgi:hypothetical protein